MVKEGYITQAQADSANAEPLKLAEKKKRAVQASYFLDYVANELVGMYGANRVYKGGLKVYTTLDIKTQQAAEAVLGKYQGAVLAIDPNTGYIKAMVGGKNYEESQINRVITEVRQPGSAFKPFVYATALNQGLTENSIIIDEPINFSGYAPLNYDKKYRGPITLKKALRMSVNSAAVKLGQQVGIDNVLELATKLGITTLSVADNNLAAALGGLTQGVNLLDLCSAYAVFANGGTLSKPISILKVLDESNQTLHVARLNQQVVLRSDIAYLITDMLKGVIDNGTGTAAKAKVAAAGKTGTTDNYGIAWFVGYTPELLVGIYVGNDNRKPVGLSGSEVAAMWGTMINKLPYSKIDFPIPANIINNILICTETGKLAGPSCIDVENDAFIYGTQPNQQDTFHNFNLKNKKSLFQFFGYEKNMKQYMKHYIEYGIILKKHL